MLPSLADHLFLAVCRPEPWETQEVFHRAVEATHLLRLRSRRLDWGPFEALVSRYGFGWIAASMLALIREDLQVSMPDGIVERIWRRAGPFKRLQVLLGRTPAYKRGQLKEFVRELADIAKTQEALSVPAFIVHAIRHPQLCERMI